MQTRAPVAGLVAVLLLLLPGRPGRADEASTSIRLEPPAIRMGLTFGGTTVHVEGSVPDGSSIAVVLAGQEGTVELKKLGKVWGMLWMNVGDIAYERVPSLYMLATSAPLAELAPAAVLDSLGVGYDALTARAVETTEDPERRGLFGELIELKEHEALYALLEGAVTLEPTGDGTAQFETSCRLPSDLRPGTIDVRLFAFRDGAGRLVDHTTIAVEQVGMAATITRLATTRGTLYGVLAVVFALVVGLLTGFIFGRGKKQTGS